jgi:hypothetical protein
MAILYIFWTFRKFCGNVVNFSPFWYIVPRKKSGSPGLLRSMSDNSLDRMSGNSFGQNRSVASPLGNITSLFKKEEKTQGPIKKILNTLILNYIHRQSFV